jgi:hydroxypyruvate isomerase
MKKSACIETLFTELPFEARFKAAKDAGFDCVEFWSWTDKNLDVIKSASEKAGIVIASMSGDRDFSLVDPEHKVKYIEFVKKSMEAAKRINCGTLVIHSNALGEGGKVVNHYTNLSHTVKLCSMFDMLRDLAPIAEKAGIVLVLEALNITLDHVGNFLETTQMGAEMTRIIGSKNIKLLYDVYHMQMNEGSICDTLSAYIDQIGYIHAADTPGRHEPGTGEINYANVLRHLEKIGYKGVVGYELFPKKSTADSVKAIMAL